jgi:ferredoxin
VSSSRLFVRLRIAAAVTAALLFTAGYLLPHSIFGPAAELIASLQLVPATLSLSLLVISVQIILAFAFGRFYCSVLCPLGLFQDAVSRLYRSLGKAFGHACSSRPRGGYRREPKLLRALVLAAAIGSLIAGAAVVLDFLEPYSFSGRILHDLAVPLIALGSRLIFPLLKTAGIFTVPMETSVDGLLFAVTSAATVGLIAAVLFRGRLFCDAVCPAGTILRTAALRPLFGIRVDQTKCSDCGNCGIACPVGCIAASKGRVDDGRCVRCFECMAACPYGAISFGLATRSPFSTSLSARALRALSKKTENSTDSSRMSRKDFLALLAASAAALAAAGTIGSIFRPNPRYSLDPASGDLGAGASARLPAYASPPGSDSLEKFSASCTACHLCVTRCPTGVLTPLPAAYGSGGLLQPAMNYRAGFCDYECAVCTKVCPTGAIKPLDLRRKQLTQIAKARLFHARCVVFTRGTACGACAEVCPTHAVHMAPYLPLLTAPETDSSLCIGCGSCQFACPVAEPKAIIAEPLPVHRIIDDRKGPLPEGPYRRLVPGAPPEPGRFSPPDPRTLKTSSEALPQPSPAPATIPAPKDKGEFPF